MRARPAPPTPGGAFVRAAALLGGCAAAPQVAELAARPPADLPVRVALEQTPFFPQEDYQCGPAALAAVLQHAGIHATPASLVPQVFVPARKGSLQAEMLAATRRRGLLAYELAPRLDALLAEIAGGTPVVVLQNLALDWAPQWHYAVAIGYDLDAREIVLRSGVTRRLVMRLDTFERTWARSGYWAMLALPPEQLAASAEESRVVEALAALERAAPAAALAGYRAVLKRWPESYAAALGLGNASYASRDLAGAAAAYRRAAARRPGSGDAWNNLAQALSELGERDGALAAARRAVALGGARLATYRETLEHIQRLP